MPPFIEVHGYAPCPTEDELCHVLDQYGNLLVDAGMDASKVKAWIENNKLLLPKGEANPRMDWCPIRSSDFELSGGPLLMYWNKSFFPELDHLWLDLALIFEIDHCIQPDSQFKSEDRFLPGVSRLLWKLLRQFYGQFGSMGAYVFLEINDGPWEALIQGNEIFCDFYMALIPKSLKSHFTNLYCNIITREFDYGIGMISKGTDRWSIIWPEIPWKIDGKVPS